jgi:hypothetical protein
VSSRFLTAIGTHFHWDLIRCTANATRAYLNQRHRIPERLREDVHRVASRLFADDIQRLVRDPFGNGLLAARHHLINEAREHFGIELRIR